MQGQLSGFDSLTAFLRLLRESNSLIYIVITCKILGPQNETSSVLLYTVLTEGISKVSIYYFTHFIGEGL